MTEVGRTAEFTVDQTSIDPSFFGMASWNPDSVSAARVPRRDAMQVPAVKRSRDLIAGTIGGLPLFVLDDGNRRTTNPLFEQPEVDVPRSVTMVRTIEDMLFEGVAWWRIIEMGPFNFPLKVVRLDVGSVNVRKDHRVFVRPDGTNQGSRWEYVPDSQLIRFDSPNDPLLTAGARAIRTCMKLDIAAARYADEPQMQGYFSPVEGADPADDDDVEDLLEDWRKARQARITGYVPASLKYNEVDGWSPSDLQLTEARQHAVLEISRLTGIDADYLAANPAGASETYANSVDKRLELVDFTLAPYVTALTDRLSMGDVTPPGYRVRADYSAFVRANEQQRMETYEIAMRVGAYGPEEVARREELPALPKPVPTPTEQEAPVQQSQNAESAGATFDRETGITFDAPSVSESFRVDPHARTITGLVVPYGPVASKHFRKFRFTKGSLKYTDAKRVKLLRDHDNSQAIGVLVKATETEQGMFATFKVARGPAGDEALALAEDGVLDGFSVGVDFTEDGIRMADGVTEVLTAAWRETSLTAVPAFDDARVTSVEASDNGRNNMKCTTCQTFYAEGTTCACPTPTPAPAPAEQFTALTESLTTAIREGFANLQIPAQREVIPAGRVPAVVNEPLPYRFDRGGNFDPESDHVFSADLHAMALARDNDGSQTDAGKRVMDLLKETFAVVGSNVDELNPTIQRPDMYVDQRDYKTPAWDIVNKGAPPNGVQPFMFPKFNSASGLVADHTEGTEPTSGAFTTTSQTVTPTAISGKASIVREVWDMGGNPAVSTLIFNQMKRGWFEGLETATATFLNTLTAATDLPITAGASDDILGGEWDAHLAGLQFVRGYDFSAFLIEQVLYKAFVAAADGNGRKLYPILAPSNANGTAASRFRTLDLGGVTGVPSWALASTPGSVNNSWLFDPSTVHGWASAPQRLEFAGTNAAGDYSPVAHIDLAIWGYKAFACSDIAGVRQVTYDSVP